MQPTSGTRPVSVTARRAIVYVLHAGRTGTTGDGSTPIDLVVTGNGQFVYSLNSGTQTIGAFRVGADGSLTALPFTGGLPAGANGLASKQPPRLRHGAVSCRPVR